jgi:hypothetical protein
MAQNRPLHASICYPQDLWLPTTLPVCTVLPVHYLFRPDYGHSPRCQLQTACHLYMP